jgi:hypothetical protein
LPLFTYFIIFIKLIFLFSAVSHIYYKKVSKSEKKSSVTLFWKERTEYIFSICMAILLIIIFNPWHNGLKYLNGEIKVLFYLFGWILIFTSNWGSFVQEAPWYSKLVNAWK